ncbi:MAG: hypothetical protein JWP97_2308 [Labilithrix sp.]|nr:hypothetical protein [Labilithrix sp.]
MARSTCRSTFIAAGLAALGLASCTGTDPYRPGQSIGVFHVTAALKSSSCGATPNPWEFDVRLRHELSRLYWVQGDRPISATVDAASHATLKATSTQTVREAAGKTAACAMQRDDVVDVTLSGVTTNPTVDLAPADAFLGTMSYHFTAVEGSSCDDQLSAAGGDFDALPCDIAYELKAKRTGDAK